MRPNNILHIHYYYITLVGLMVVAGVLGVALKNAHSAQAMNLKSVENAVDVPQLYGSPISLGSGIQAVANAAPTLADLNGDSKLDIIVGTRNGWVVAISGSNGSILWKKDVRQYGFQTSTCGTVVPINSSPAVGYLRQPGSPTSVLGIAVGVGSLLSTNGNGGVIAFDKNGNWLWTRLTQDGNGDGCTDGVNASPTIADLNKDGRDEVLYGSFDQCFYVLNNDGTDFPSWPLQYRDTIWSSPAVGDIDGDGQNEIVIASDAGQTDQPCPYPLPWSYNYCGGEIDVRRLDGTEEPGFPFRTWQAIQSQPALADLNGDGKIDIIVGSGTFYDTADSFLVYALDYTGNLLPGWPVNLQGATDGEPAVGDLNGDGKLEVVMGTGDYYAASAGWKLSPHPGWLQAIWSDGNSHPGGPFMWRLQPLDTINGGSGPIRAPMIVDINNDGHLDVIYSFSWEVQIIDGQTGLPIIGGYHAANSLRMYTNSYNIPGPVAIGDLNGDGKLDIIAGSASDGSGNTGAVYVWNPGVVSQLNISSGTPSRPWPMFRQNAAHAGQYVLPSLQGGPSAITQLDVPGGTSTYTYVFPVQNAGNEPVRFTTAVSGSPACGSVNVQPASPVTINPDRAQNMTVTLNLSSCTTRGTYNLGTITMTGTYGSVSTGIHALNSPHTVPIRALIVNTIYRSSLPLILR